MSEVSGGLCVNNAYYSIIGYTLSKVVHISLILDNVDLFTKLGILKWCWGDLSSDYDIACIF